MTDNELADLTAAIPDGTSDEMRAMAIAVGKVVIALRTERDALRDELATTNEVYTLAVQQLGESIIAQDALRKRVEAATLLQEVVGHLVREDESGCSPMTRKQYKALSAAYRATVTP